MAFCFKIRLCDDIQPPVSLAAWEVERRNEEERAVGCRSTTMFDVVIVCWSTMHLLFYHGEPSFSNSVPRGVDVCRRKTTQGQHQSYQHDFPSVCQFILSPLAFAGLALAVLVLQHSSAFEDRVGLHGRCLLKSLSRTRNLSNPLLDHLDSSDASSGSGRLPHLVCGHHLTGPASRGPTSQVCQQFGVDCAGTDSLSLSVPAQLFWVFARPTLGCQSRLRSEQPSFEVSSLATTSSVTGAKRISTKQAAPLP